MKVHVVAADWYDGLHILAAGPEGLVELPWAGGVQWDVGQDRVCVGRITRDGHVPCPWQNAVGHDAQCGGCAPAWSACVFEPVEHGPGDRCALCQRPHVVYLALYGGLAKVGMTTAGRVDVRLTEQGADAYFIVQERPDRVSARRTEQTVSSLYGVPERRRHTELLRLWARPVDTQLIEAKAATWRERLGGRFDVGPLRFLPQTLPPLGTRPHRAPPVGRHEGQALGAKGDYLFYRGAGDLAGPRVVALQRSALPGRFVTVQ